MLINHVFLYKTKITPFVLYFIYYALFALHISQVRMKKLYKHSFINIYFFFCHSYRKFCKHICH